VGVANGPRNAGSHNRRLLVLEGEENYDEMGLDGGKEIFIDDILETAKWYVVLNMSRLTLPYPPRVFESKSVTRELPNNYPFIDRSEGRHRLGQPTNGTTLQKRYSISLSRH
jgi:hypothetical protein